MEREIRKFIKSHFRAGIGVRPLDDATPLFSSGIIDSFGVLELISFLEQTFHVEIDPARQALTDFDTVTKIAQLVSELRGRQG